MSKEAGRSLKDIKIDVIRHDFGVLGQRLFFLRSQVGGVVLRQDVWDIITALGRARALLLELESQELVELEEMLDDHEEYPF